MRNLSEKRIDEALGAFRETLLAFCETVLPGGRRSGNKWICGDLHDGEGGSCAVFLDSGGFNDTNPAADHVKGGPIGLWKAIFGVSSFVEVIKGMEAWVKDGSLPDGSKGRHRAGKIEDSGGEPIVAQDAYEKNRIRNIEAYQLWIKDAPEHPHWYVRPPYEDVASYVKSNERAVEWQLSEIYAHRWQKAVENTNGIREETASELAEYRGLSRDVFLWLVDNGYIAVVYSEKFDSLEIAFPVFRNTQWF